MISHIAVIAVAFTAGLALAADPVITPLSYTPVASPELIITGPARLAAGSVGWIPLPELRVTLARQGQADHLTIAGQEVTLSWTGPKDFTITAAGKAQTLRPIPKSYGLQPTIIGLAGGKRYTLAFPVAQVGMTKGGQRAVIFCRSGSSQNGSLDGETVSLYDANTDGIYERGRDSIRVGPAGKPLIFSPALEYFATSKAIYKLDHIAKDGASLTCSRYDGEAGKLHVEFASGTSELSLILTSADGQMSAVSNSSNKLRPDLLLIPGEYRVRYGVVTLAPQGKITAVVSPASVDPIAIESANTVSVEFGAPYKLEFAAVRKGSQFTLDPANFVLSGKSGETYVSYNWSQPPDVSLQSSSNTRPAGQMAFTDGAITAFAGPVPEGMGAGVKVLVSGVIEGLGPVKGEATLD